MATFLNLGNRIVNAEQVVVVEWLKAEPAKTRWDPDARQDRTVPAQPVRVVLTLTSVELESIDYYGEGPGRAAASASQTITVRGSLAEKVWLWFQNRADVAELEEAPDMARGAPAA